MTDEQAYNLLYNCVDRADIRVAIQIAMKALKEKSHRNTGKWIEDIPEHGKCPFCGNHVDLMGGKENNYCGECGAYLR